MERVQGENLGGHLLSLGKAMVNLSRYDYMPVGHYVVFEAGDTCNVSVCQGDTFQTTTEDKQDFSLAHHDLRAYQRIMDAKSRRLKEICTLVDQEDRRIDGPPGNEPSVMKSPGLSPEVYDVISETFSSGKTNHFRIIRVYGRNLDLLRGDSVTMDKERLDANWSSNPLLRSTVLRQSVRVLVLEHQLKETTPGKPKHDIPLVFQSDLLTNKNIPYTIEATLSRNKCHEMNGTPEDPLVFYGGQFFLDSQQQAWIMKQLFGDDSLERQLKRFQELVTARKCVGDTTFLTMQPAWEKLEDVGKRVPGIVAGKVKDNDSSQSRMRDELYDWIVPPKGLVLRTKGQVLGIVAVTAMCCLLGGGIIVGGGLGIILGFGTSLTGGFVSAPAVIAAGCRLAFHLFHSKLHTKYYVMLEDFVKLYRGSAPKTMSEFDLEEELFRAQRDYAGEAAAKDQQKTTCFEELSNQSKSDIKARVELIKGLHAIKRERLKGTLVAVCGPRDSGKTTLVSQLLQRPELEHGTGMSGGENETRTITPYPVPCVHSFALLDTPGLTGPEIAMREKFDKAALNLASAHVCIREFQGLPTKIDLETVRKIRQCAARSQEPKILICLNRGAGKLTQDATGQTHDLTAKDFKKKWLDHLNVLRSKESTSIVPNYLLDKFSTASIRVEFVELHGDRNLEATFNNDSRTNGILTASSIGEWIARETQAENDN